MTADGSPSIDVAPGPGRASGDEVARRVPGGAARAWRARVDRRGQLDQLLDRRAAVAELTLDVPGPAAGRGGRGG